MPDLDQLLVAISHRARRAILARLKRGPLMVTEIAAPFDLSLNAVSKHLKMLEAAGLIRRERQGREHLIHLQPGALRQVADWVDGYEAYWNHQLDRLEEHFQAKKEQAMTQAPKTLTVNLKRVIAGAPAKVFEAWLDPEQPCNPWSYGKHVVLEPKVGKPFCIVMGSAGAHFGRILKLAKGKQLQFTWMSRYTRGLESTVTIDFKKHVAGTLMTLRHSGLPNDAGGRGHAAGWGHFLGMVEKYFAGKKQASKRPRLGGAA